MKIVLIGAGSAQFGYGTMGEVFQSKVLEGTEIALVDINSSALDEVHRTGREFLDRHKLEFSLTAYTDRKDALKGADYVIISIEVGDRFALWDMDWKIPLQFGVKQVYGENGGPGGIFHSLRIIPPFLEICADIAQYCPNAVIFNYSNPMTAITTTVLRKFPQLKFIGMCHEIASLKRYLPLMLNTPIANLKLRAGGLNHFSVLVEAHYADSGKNAYPDILEKALPFFEKEPGFSEVWEYTQRTGRIPHTEGASERWDIDHKQSLRPWSDRHLFRVLLETYQLLPITTDSHLGEYIAWGQEASDHRGILDFYAFYRYALSRQVREQISLTVHERVIPVIEGIVTDSGYEEMAVNILNSGAIPGLPDDIAVEVPAIIGKHGVEPVKFQHYPKGFAALLRSYTGVYDLTAEAVLHSSRSLALQAVLACPMVHSHSGMAEMVDTMVDRQKKWLGYLK